ncbi:MAG: transposase family protein [Acidobacteria bacterium]|nr:transposase family protein [Acidobacteriota bacterium]
MPWARDGSGHARHLDDQASSLVTHTSKSAIAKLLRVSWRRIGAIIIRVVADLRATKDPLEGGDHDARRSTKGHRARCQDDRHTQSRHSHEGLSLRALEEPRSPE